MERQKKMCSRLVDYAFCKEFGGCSNNVSKSTSSHRRREELNAPATRMEPSSCRWVYVQDWVCGLHEVFFLLPSWPGYTLGDYDSAATRDCIWLLAGT
ncbi:hypothetical protein GHT06_017569 [Daphnia sinensis]|uniref:Uncharacterized protein n=1 Tax=Daphnia sinensis TaxID=1820382 RepID=A0AAD5L7T1_9CRUS|nr:hypothetical protein GHT06_017569 [Daphnia sinensis]